MDRRWMKEEFDEKNLIRQSTAKLTVIELPLRLNWLIVCRVLVDDLWKLDLVSIRC